MRWALVSIVMLLSGCGTHTALGIRTGAGGPAPQASAGFQIHPGQTAGTLIGLGLLAAFWRGESDYAERAVPELDATRRVSEQDCRKPIEDHSANLRCR